MRTCTAIYEDNTMHIEHLQEKKQNKINNSSLKKVQPLPDLSSRNMYKFPF
jgi:hypothetical protein